ncbi:MAG: ChbG/HpnK family deacetylase [Chitinivibrionales bacterium]|nr:ChbG/HpnK family deacetylase [Chitinivibrionales bacterium]
MAKEPIRIVTRGDDLGSYRSANRAILDACKKGVLRNTSVIVPAEHFEKAAEMFSNEKDICVGLHACITCEWENVRWKPLLPADRVRCILEADGTLNRSVNAIHDGGPRFSEIMAELQAQLDRARERKLDIRYVDAHMAFPWIFEESDEHRLRDEMVRWAEREGVIWSGWGDTLGLKHFEHKESGDDTITALADAIRSAEGGNYLIVSHPAYNDDEMQPARYDDAKPGQIAQERDLQRRMFMDPLILEAYKDAGAIPIRYDEV